MYREKFILQYLYEEKEPNPVAISVNQANFTDTEMVMLC
jgi:hypothetical protein